MSTPHVWRQEAEFIRGVLEEAKEKIHKKKMGVLEYFDTDVSQYEDEIKYLEFRINYYKEEETKWAELGG